MEIYDCTLREGEQAGGISFGINDRIEIIKKLDEIGIDFIEVGWPVHQEVLETFLKLKNEALKAKIVAFGSTSISENPEEDKNLSSLVKSKAEYACIFGKTWLEHVEKQLGISTEENLEKIRKSIEFLKSKSMEVFYDAEHFFDGFKSNKEYALKTILEADKAGATRIILCDTNGGTLPEEVEKIIQETKDFFIKNNITGKLGVHFHNDSGLALANALESINYIEQVQGTINGFGERVGNLDLCEFIPLIMLKKNIKLDYKIEKLKQVSELVCEKANLPRKIGQAFVSQRAFSHKGGVHIDAINKGASYGHVNPQVLGMNHSFTLTSLGGSAGIISIAKKFNLVLDKKDAKTKEKINKLIKYLNELEKEGYDIGNIEAEQFMIIQKYFGDFKDIMKLKEWKIETDGKKSKAWLKIKFNAQEIEKEKEIQGGPVDALFKTLVEIISEKKNINLKLEDYKVRIAKPLGAESPVRTRIEFSSEEKFSCVGVNSNIIQSSLEAMEKAVNYYLNQKKN